MTDPTMPLNNDGDEVLLIDGGGVVRSQVAYGENEVRVGQWVEFGERGEGAEEPPEPRTDQRLDNLDNDADSILRQLPGVAQVTRRGPERSPSHRIVHLLDWHFVPKDMYAADLRSQSDERITDEEIDRAWEEHLREVSAVQDEQMLILDRLVQLHGLRRVHVEGLMDQDVPIFEAKVAALRRFRGELDELRGLLADDDASTEQLEALERQCRRDCLQLGAAGRLLMDGRIEAVLPLEAAKAYEAADPVAEDGTVVLDYDKIEARQDGQVRTLLKAGAFAFVILGGAHDLQDNITRLAGGDCEYVVVTTRAYRRLGADSRRQ